eukprot:TRINITY_DN1228_c0_g1_i8.p1 TRINITY_DN1228_c0_g1~~TRINITY_DN1228_c0_g1_i8.p1  ORF type:complete len:433 (-),score=182.01 TRINITY_DN1228_c0_g1_i8:81-1379(-)
MSSIVKMPPIKKKETNLSSADNQLVLRDPEEVRRATRQGAMLKNMRGKFGSIEKQLRKDPNFDIDEKDMEMLRSYVVATTQPLQSIKLLKEQAKEREAAEEYESELEKIIQRAEVVDRTTKEYTNEQKDAIALINGKDKILKDAARLYETEVQREKEEDKRIAELTKEIEKVKAENLALEKKNMIVTRGINKMRRIKEFLEEVAKSREEFDKKIELVKSRFDTLRSGSQELKKNLELLDKKIEQERTSSINKLEDLEKEILLEQNKRPDIRKRLEDYEKKINTLSDKEKHGHENLIRKHKKWTQIRLAIDHLVDFIDHFTEVTTGEDGRPKPMGPKFQVTLKDTQEEMTANQEIEELHRQVAKLKKIKKQAAYWYNIYGQDMAAFNSNALYDEIKAKKKPLAALTQSSISPKKKVEGGQTGITETTKRFTSH